ncbi:hypothetical protein ACPV5R_18555 [Vibrio astriarenae]
MSSSAIADTAVQSGGKLPASGIIYILIFTAYSVSVAGGLFLLYKLIDGVRNYSELVKSDPHLSKKIAVRLMLSGALLNPQGLVSMITASTIGDDGNKAGQCYAYSMDFDMKMDTFSDMLAGASGGVSDVKKNIWSNISSAEKTKNKCYEEATSAYISMLVKELHKSEQELFDKLMSSKVRFLIGLVQVIGLFFFINAWLKVYAISEGSDRQSTYKGQAVVIIMSSLIINLPNTAKLIINTYAHISF